MLKFFNFLKSNEQLKIEELKEKLKEALNTLNTQDMKTNDLDDIKSNIKNFKTNYDEFINVYQNANNLNLKDKILLFDEVKKLKEIFNPLEEEFIIRYLNHLATQLNGTVLETNNLKKGSTYYRLENYELIKLGVFLSKTSDHSNEMRGKSYNTFDLLVDDIDMFDIKKYYIEVEVKPEEKKPGGNPKKTRRRKNKKRRSSKQQKSKK